MARYAQIKYIIEDPKKQALCLMWNSRSGCMELDASTLTRIMWWRWYFRSRGSYSRPVMLTSTGSHNFTPTIAIVPASAEREITWEEDQRTKARPWTSPVVELPPKTRSSFRLELKLITDYATGR